MQVLKYTTKQSPSNTSNGKGKNLKNEEVSNGKQFEKEKAKRN